MRRARLVGFGLEEVRGGRAVMRVRGHRVHIRRAQLLMLWLGRAVAREQGGVDLLGRRGGEDGEVVAEVGLRVQEAALGELVVRLELVGEGLVGVEGDIRVVDEGVVAVIVVVATAAVVCGEVGLGGWVLLCVKTQSKTDVRCGGGRSMTLGVYMRRLLMAGGRRRPAASLVLLLVHVRGWPWCACACVCVCVCVCVGKESVE